MSNSRVSSDNNNAMSELAKKAGEPVFIANKGEEMFSHRDAIYDAELSRLSGEPVYFQSEIDALVEALIGDKKNNKADGHTVRSLYQEGNMNVYLTGDTHGRFERIACFCRDYLTTREDVLIILGDAGVNYYLNHRDEKLKRYIATMPIKLLCIHGNHEARPTAALGYEPVERFGGTVMAQREYPNLLFALDSEVYELGGRSCIAIGGAYSIDKHYRLLRGAAW